LQFAPARWQLVLLALRNAGVVATIERDDDGDEYLVASTTVLRHHTDADRALKALKQLEPATTWDVKATYYPGDTPVAALTITRGTHS
jgi:hypothetical protein